MTLVAGVLDPEGRETALTGASLDRTGSLVCRWQLEQTPRDLEQLRQQIFRDPVTPDRDKAAVREATAKIGGELVVSRALKIENRNL